MKTRVKPPIIPTSKTDPTRVGDLVLSARKDVRERFKRIAKQAAEVVKQIPVKLAVNRRYEFLIDQYILDNALSGFDRILSEALMEIAPGGSIWLSAKYVELAYKRGTQMEAKSLANQSMEYEAISTDVLISERYRNRIALVRARQFEEMQGLTADMKTRLSRTLSNGIARGLNPDVIAQHIKHDIDVSESRANLIARTEITQALRRARWEEATDAEQAFSFTTKLLHLSALSPTTRPSHMERHGKLYTREEVEEFYSDAGNACNCKCAQTAVLVDSDGNPLSPALVRRMQQMRDAAIDKIDDVS